MSWFPRQPTDLDYADLPPGIANPYAGAVDRPSEFSHGLGLRPRGLLRAPVEDGGYYFGKCPPTAPDRKGTQRSGFPGRVIRP